MQSPTTAMLEVVDLRKKYGQQEVLKGISFTVPAGTCFGLLGPNGAGKSTTMKILTGVVHADSGEARLSGQDMRHPTPEIRRQIGYVPQEITLYTKLSAYENLRFFGEMYGVPARQLKVRIREVLEQTGLTARAQDTIEKFSGGMKRRINIAAALLHQPKVLILDEPTVGIDPQSRNHIFEMIRSLKAEGMTIIYSTHYMEEVEALCDEIAIVDSGHVVAQGSLHSLLQRYANLSVYVEMDSFTDFPDVPSATKVHPKGRGWVIETPTPAVTLQFLLAEAESRRMTIEALEIMRPSLEDVFLSLTGTSLRD
jgi:ABC-2 type transport system ATP-binding protein